MGLAPRRQSRVVWEEGMYLAPHHFQAQRRHCEDTIAATLEALFPFAYGVTSASLDTEALASGTLALAFARGIMPDGTVVSVPDADAPPPPASLTASFAPDRDAHVVYLALPAWNDSAANVRFTVARTDVDPLAPPANGHAPRYIEQVSSVRDETAGEESTEVHFATKHLRLVLDTQLERSDVALALARVRRNDVGQFVADPDFIPPCLKIGASERLVAILRRVVGMVEAKGQALGATLDTSAGAVPGAAPAAYIGNELATRWLLHAVRSAEAPLRHLLSTRSAHPEQLWLELSQLAGALCTFSLSVEARALPVYAHDDLGTCFGAIEQHLRAHLDVVIAANAVVVPLAKVSEVLYTATISDPRCYDTGARWFLGVRSSVGTTETLGRAQQFLKVCASKFVLELVRRAYPGLELEHIPAPPAGLAPRADLSYFEITMAGPCEQGLRDTRELGVYVPEALPDAVLELSVLVPA
ncbi:MAG: type VI secretion system baseplate subunit TssK [Gemmatimonadaceae bacterium]|nr:type VI secretion system baseplate subunit TssK [Gemmatimonadaceae bacterium]